MSYATRADLEARYTTAEVAQLEASGRNIAAAQADADAVIDSYLGTRYVVPITGTVPPVIVACACDLARFVLYGVSAEGEPADRNAMQRAWLKDVSLGKANIAGLTELSSGSSAAGVGDVRVGQGNSNFDWGAD